VAIHRLSGAEFKEPPQFFVLTGQDWVLDQPIALKPDLMASGPTPLVEIDLWSLQIPCNTSICPC
jgi:hypothetical protein